MRRVVWGAVAKALCDQSKPCAVYVDVRVLASRVVAARLIADTDPDHAHLGRKNGHLFERDKLVA